MNIADTSSYTIRVNLDVYYVLNKTLSDLTYTLYREDQTLSKISEVTLSASEEQAIVFDGDGTYKVYIESDIVEIRYYLQLQATLIATIGDFLCDCCNYSTLDYDCSCSTPIDVNCVQFSAIPMMLLSYQHLVSYCLNSCCAGQYLYDAANFYEYVLRESYLGHIQEECIKGKSLYGTRGLRYLTAIYYALFLEGELDSRDTADADFIYAKFDFDRIKGCMEDLGISYDKLLEIMGLCDDRLAQIQSDLDSIKATVESTETTVDNIDEAVSGSGGGGTSGDNLQDSIDNVYEKVVTIENTVENCCDVPGNQPPTANAGIDQNIDVSDPATLDGSGSTDGDGTIVSYLWQVLASPVTVSITSPTSVSTGVTGFTAEGNYTFSLTVTDNNGASDIDTILVVVGAVVPTAINSEINNNRAGDCAADHTFAAGEFDFIPSADTLESIKITDVTGITAGTLKYNTVTVVAPLDIITANIGLLVYAPLAGDTSQHDETFSFSVKTVESAVQSNVAVMTAKNTSCAAAIAQIQLTDDGDVDIACGSLYTVSGVVEGVDGTRSFKIKNLGDAPLVGVLVVGGADASNTSLDSYIINVAAVSTQVIAITIDTTGEGGNTLLSTITMTTNSDINPTCVLNTTIIVAAVASPPTTLVSDVLVERLISCTDILTFDTLDFPYTDGSPAGRTHIRIDSLPATGVMKLGALILGVDLAVPVQIAEGSIGDLTYTPDGTSTGASDVTFDIVSSNDSGSTWG